jgi:multiple sugar transport system permease protein
MKRTSDGIVGGLGLVIFILVVYFPIYWLVAMSLKTRVDILTMPPVWFFTPTVANYLWIFQTANLVSALRSSVIVALSTTGLAAVFGLPAAYALTRFQLRRKRDLEFWILSTRMLPPVAVIIPFYMIWSSVHLLDSYVALVVTYLVTILPLVIWLMRGFFVDLPVELEEAGMVDGLSRWGTFLRVALPLSIPGLSVAAMLAFLFTWNEYFFAFVLTSTRSTLPVAVASFMTHGLELKYGEMAAAGVIATLPALLFVTLARRVIVRGLTGLVR